MRYEYSLSWLRSDAKWTCIFDKKTFYSNSVNFKWLLQHWVIDWILCCSRFDMPPFIRKLVNYFVNYDLKLESISGYGVTVTEWRLKHPYTGNVNRLCVPLKYLLICVLTQKQVEIHVHLAWLFMSITINSISNVLKVLELQFIMAISYFQF